MHEIGVREVVHFAGLTFNWETLCMTWLTMAIVILISWLATRNLKMIPTGWQNVVEILVSWLDTQVSSMMGKRGLFLAPFIMSLFMFLLTSNWLGLIPTLSSPTNDLNTTLGLALLVVVLVHVLGVHEGRSLYRAFLQADAGICHHQRDRRDCQANHAVVPSIRQHPGR